MKLFIFKIKEEYTDILSFFSEKLTEKELKDINEFKFDKGKTVKAVSILLLKYVVEKYFNIKNYSIYINKYGKPYIADMENKYFNISHSENYIICGASEYELGVDIEYLKPFRNILEIAKRFFTKEEYNILNSVNESSKQMKLFYDIWTKKESFIKAVGQGLSLGLNNFCVPIDINNNKISYLGEEWYFMTEKQYKEKYSISVCEKRESSNRIELINLNLDDLIN